MNELTELRMLRADTPAMSQRALVQGRARLSAATASTAARPFGPRRRFVVALTAGVALAATATGIAVIGSPEGTRPANAAAVLERAAAALESEPGSEPRPDQFIFEEVRQLATNGRPDLHLSFWTAVDGGRPGLARMVDESGTCGRTPAPDTRIAVVGPDGKELVFGPGEAPRGYDPCGHDLEIPVFDPADGLGSAPYAVLAKLPTDPDGLIRALGADRVVAMASSAPSAPSSAPSAPSVSGGPYSISRELQIWTLARTVAGRLPSAQRAAMFRALAKLPGVTVHPDITDAAGRVGTGVGMTDPRLGEVVLVFDKATHRYTGEVILADGRESLSRAIVRTAVVARVGEQPA